MNRVAARVFILLFLTLAAAGCLSAPAVGQTAAPTLPNPPTFTYPPPPPAIDSTRRLILDGFERTYLLHVPSGTSARTPVALVLVFHGHRMSGESLRAASGFNAIADTNKFLVAYPNGTGTAGAMSFNAGLCCGAAVANHVDEAEFVRRILADLGGSFTIDPARVYAAGFSNGAMLAYRLACEMSETFAAAAPVAGNLAFGPCQPRKGLSLIHIQGLSDISIPYSDDDLEPDSNPDILSVERSVAFWASVDGCSNFPALDQEGIVTRTIYSSCAGGTSVMLYSLKGVGHTWPPDAVFPASQTIWDFFSAHPKQ